MAKAITNTQRRAICPACFNQQAIRADGTMVQHGYQRPQGWHSNVGDCYGTGKPHFGTPEGRAVTQNIAVICREDAHKQRDAAADVLAGTGKVFNPRHNKYNKTEPLFLENPTQHQRETQAAKHIYQAEMHDRAAADYQARYDAWQAAEPVVVEVEKKGPVVHYRPFDSRQANRPECAGPMYSSYNAVLTDDRSKVTCTRCIKRFPWVDARQRQADARKGK